MFELDYAECVRLATRASEVAEAARVESARIWADVFVGSGLCGLGELEKGLTLMDESRCEAMARGLLWIARNALHNSIVRRFMALRAAEAKPLLEFYRDLYSAWFEPFDQGGVWWNLGFPQKALPFYEQALALARESDSSTGENWIRRDMASARSALGQFAEARAVLPALESQRELQDARPTRHVRMRVFLDSGDLQAAASEAMAVFSRPLWGSVRDTTFLFDPAVEALLATGQVSEAEKLVASTRVILDDDPYQHRMEGRLALTKGNISEARDRLLQAVQRFQQADYGIEVMRSRRALAEAEVAAGDRAAAAEQLRLVVQMADQRDAVLQGHAARERLAELGIEVDQKSEAAVPEPSYVSERLVTVLFLDIRGYSSMSAREAPERIADTVAGLYRWARQEVERHHGLVDRYEGDAVIATFNVSGARLDHCLHAMQAAIAIRDKAAAAGLPIGAGIAVGQAVVGRLTSASQVSTFGEVTNLAARLQARAEPGEILLSEEAYRRTRDWLSNKQLAPTQDSLELKGFAGQVVAFRLGPATQSATSRS
jgi:class 3 adenylate cyclase